MRKAIAVLLLFAVLGVWGYWIWQNKQHERPAHAANAHGPNGTEEIPADAVFLLTGYRADSDLMERAGVTFNHRGAPHHNPETFETNVPNLFVAGGAIAGEDTGTVFIENGRFHGAKIIDVISARR